MSKKILVVGSPGITNSELLLQTMKEKFGDDIILVTPEQAKEEGLKRADFENVSSMKISQAHPILPSGRIDLKGAKKSGKESRRQRREQDRKYNNKYKR